MAKSSSCSYDLKSLLSSPERDFLVRSNGDQVKINELSGKTIGLYFSSSWNEQRPQLERKLVNSYNKVRANNDHLEIVLVPARDDDELSFNAYFSEMPWLAIPFSDSETCLRLNQLFEVDNMSRLVMLDPNGKVVSEYELKSFTDSTEMISIEEKAKEEQTLRTLLVTDSRDFLISNEGNQIPVSKLEGKTIGLYFSAFEYYPTLLFTRQLTEVYGKLKENGESFEVVLVSLDDDEDYFKDYFEEMPWLALPFDDESCHKLAQYFEVSTFPTLVILGPDGKTMHSNVAKYVEEYGIQAYPFTLEKLAELDKIDMARRESQTLSSLLVTENRDFLIRQDGSKVPVSELEGKVVGLYFSTSAYYLCDIFTEKLLEVYRELKDNNDNGDNSTVINFEVVMISFDYSEQTFKQSFEGKPWLSLPFNDEGTSENHVQKLCRYFDLSEFPTLVIIGQDGKTLNSNAVELIEKHGSQAFPFIPPEKPESATMDPLARREWVIEGIGSQFRVIYFDD